MWCLPTWWAACHRRNEATDDPKTSKLNQRLAKWLGAVYLAKKKIMKYPGRIIKKGEASKTIVKAVQKRLTELGIDQFGDSGVFGPKTESAVKMFQARFSDAQGNPLVVDGQLGSISWEALFGVALVVPPTEAKKGLEAVLAIAEKEVGTREEPLGSNWGPKVQAYLSRAGVPFAAAWCAAFVYWCFDEAAAAAGIANPVFKTAGVMLHWNKTAGKKILAKDAINNPALIKPGHIFMMSFGGGLGHTGIVKSVNGGFITVIEGNTNDGGSREGIGVFERIRKISSINKGFIEYKM
jgi:peptidoglycan hydrolase-like protein with peptidoglycan-binding domain